LEQLDPIKTKVVVICEADGKTQLFAIGNIGTILEDRLGNPLSQYADLFVGISAGTYLASGAARGIPQREIVDLFQNFPSSMTIPASIGCCCSTTKRLRDLANAYVTGKMPGSEDESLENTYDAFKNPADFKTILRDIMRGGPATPLLDCTSSQSTDPAERIISSMKERDLAAKYNYAKLCWSNVLDIVKVVSDVAPKIREICEDSGDDQENFNTEDQADDGDGTASESESEARSTSSRHPRVVRVPASVDRSFRHTVFIRLNADTTGDRVTSIHPTVTRNPSSAEVSFNFKIPVISYPGNDLPFTVIKSWITARTETIFTDEQSESTLVMNALVGFLNERWSLMHSVPV
jgi:hypothetical protein